MPRKNGNDVQPETVHANHGWILVLVGYIWGNSTHTDSHGSDENKSVVALPLLAYGIAAYGPGAKLVYELSGNVVRGFSYLDYSYFLLHLSISMGL